MIDRRHIITMTIMLLMSASMISLVLAFIYSVRKANNRKIANEQNPSILDVDGNTEEIIIGTPQAQTDMETIVGDKNPDSIQPTTESSKSSETSVDNNSSTVDSNKKRTASSTAVERPRGDAGKPRVITHEGLRHVNLFDNLALIQFFLAKLQSETSVCLGIVPSHQVPILRYRLMQAICTEQDISSLFQRLVAAYIYSSDISTSGADDSDADPEYNKFLSAIPGLIDLTKKSDCTFDVMQGMFQKILYCFTSYEKAVSSCKGDLLPVHYSHDLQNDLRRLSWQENVKGYIMPAMHLLLSLPEVNDDNFHLFTVVRAACEAGEFLSPHTIKLCLRELENLVWDSIFADSLKGLNHSIKNENDTTKIIKNIAESFLKYIVKLKNNEENQEKQTKIQECIQGVEKVMEGGDEWQSKAEQIVQHIRGCTAQLSSRPISQTQKTQNKTTTNKITSDACKIVLDISHCIEGRTKDKETGLLNVFKSIIKDIDKAARSHQQNTVAMMRAAVPSVDNIFSIMKKMVDHSMEGDSDQGGGLIDWSKKTLAHIAIDSTLKNLANLCHNMLKTGISYVDYKINPTQETYSLCREDLTNCIGTISKFEIGYALSVLVGFLDAGDLSFLLSILLSNETHKCDDVAPQYLLSGKFEVDTSGQQPSCVMRFEQEKCGHNKKTIDQLIEDMKAFPETEFTSSVTKYLQSIASAEGQDAIQQQSTKFTEFLEQKKGETADTQYDQLVLRVAKNLINNHFCTEGCKDFLVQLTYFPETDVILKIRQKLQCIIESECASSHAKKKLPRAQNLFSSFVEENVKTQKQEQDQDQEALNKQGIFKNVIEGIKKNNSADNLEKCIKGLKNLNNTKFETKVISLLTSMLTARKEYDLLNSSQNLQLYSSKDKELKTFLAEHGMGTDQDRYYYAYDKLVEAEEKSQSKQGELKISCENAEDVIQKVRGLVSVILKKNKLHLKAENNTIVVMHNEVKGLFSNTPAKAFSLELCKLNQDTILATKLFASIQTALQVCNLDRHYEQNKQNVPPVVKSNGVNSRLSAPSSKQVQQNGQPYKI